MPLIKLDVGTPQRPPSKGQVQPASVWPCVGGKECVTGVKLSGVFVGVCLRVNLVNAKIYFFTSACLSYIIFCIYRVNIHCYKRNNQKAFH
jgi:hypothetical protein